VLGGGGIENLQFLGSASLGAGGTDGANRMIGNRANDTLRGEGGNDFLDGKGGNDNLQGGSGHDRIYGRFGNDDITGEEGNDMLYGNEGRDTIDGGDGIDRILGGQGSDLLTGGAGQDAFVYLAGDINFGSVDTITDYNSGEVINLSGVLNVTSDAQIDAFIDRSGNEVEIDFDGPNADNFTPTTFLVTQFYTGAVTIVVDGHSFNVTS